MNGWKYAQVAERIRAQVADGVLQPGEPAPSGAALSRLTGYSPLTCRKALAALVKEGVLVPGTSPNARPRIASPAITPGEQTAARAARTLSAGLASRRRAAGLTQPQLAELTGMSITTVGHAETGRLWQSRHFWEHADKELGADGELLALHAAYRAALADPAASLDEGAGIAAAEPEAVKVAAFGPVTCVAITWADGTVTTVYSPYSACLPTQRTDQPTGSATQY